MGTGRAVAVTRSRFEPHEAYTDSGVGDSGALGGEVGETSAPSEARGITKAHRRSYPLRR